MCTKVVHDSCVTVAGEHAGWGDGGMYVENNFSESLLLLIKVQLTHDLTTWLFA
jgi:hypothetical protein